MAEKTYAQEIIEKRIRSKNTGHSDEDTSYSDYVDYGDHINYSFDLPLPDTEPVEDTSYSDYSDYVDYGDHINYSLLPLPDTEPVYYPVKKPNFFQRVFGRGSR